MPIVQPLRPSTLPRRIPTPGDLRSLRLSLAGEPPRRRRKVARGRWMTPRMITVVLLLLLLAPVAGAFGGSTDYRGGAVTAGCQLVSVVDGNTVELSCPGQSRATYEVMGVQAPPILGARCLSEAWWGLRAEVSLRSILWRSSALNFVTEPRGNLVLVFADGQPLHRRITHAPRGLCA